MTGYDPDSDDLHELFHENSKNHSLDGFTRDSDSETKRLDIDYTRFPGAETIELSSASQPDHVLSRVLEERRSPDSFTGEGMTKSELATLVTASVGITEKGPTDNQHRRAYPSAGARYPLETYVCVLQSPDVPLGLYHYNVLQESLEQLRTGDLRDELTFFAHEAKDDAACVVFLTAEFQRTTAKYGDRGYRLLLQESGHLLQNMCLVAEELGLGCRPIAGFVDRKADEFLERFGSETTIYSAFVGKPQTAASQ